MDNSAIIRKIEIRLKEIGMSKSEFYRRSGISSATYSQWNTGTFSPSRKKLEAAAETIGLPVEELLPEGNGGKTLAAVAGAAGAAAAVLPGGLLPSAIAAIDTAGAFLLSGKKEKPVPQTGDGLSSKDQRLIAWFRSLPVEKQKAILNLGDGPEDLSD